MRISLSTIAIADDNVPMQIMLRRLAEKLGYVCVGTVSSREAAIELLKLQKPHVLVMDFHMPGRPPIEVIRQIAALGTTALVVITGDMDPGLAVEAMDAGACGFLRKPFDLSQVDVVLQSAWHRFQQIKTMEARIAILTQKLDLRKVLEKAKGILMKQEHLSEADAHKLLQQMSQEKGIPLKDICTSLISLRTAINRLQSPRVLRPAA